MGVITAWGIVNWDYFTKPPKASSEGWFGRDTPEGGTDKPGHIFTTYATAQGISSLFEYWCFSLQDAASYGALSSHAILGYMEVGDAFTDYGHGHNKTATFFNYYQPPGIYLPAEKRLDD